MRARVEDVGDLLRRLRLRWGLTQEGLAELIADGLSVETVSNIERGRVRPHRHNLLALLDALEADDTERGTVLDAWRLPPRPAADGGPSLSSLPVPATPLIGRDRELAALERLLGSGAVRMVTLTGPGGVLPAERPKTEPVSSRGPPRLWRHRGLLHASRVTGAGIHSGGLFSIRHGPGDPHGRYRSPPLLMLGRGSSSASSSVSETLG